MTRIGLAILVVCSFASCEDQPQASPRPEGPDVPTPFTATEVDRILRLSPLPEPKDPTNQYFEVAAAARLGQFLFFDTRLSATGDIACVTCHLPEKGWSDGKQLAEGQERLPRHAMTLWNVAYNRWFFWDGRSDSLWAQALEPLEDPREHAGNRLQYAHLVFGDADLRAAYERLFGPMPELNDVSRFPKNGRPVADRPDHIHQLAWNTLSAEDRAAVDRIFVNLGKALAAFQRRIVSRRAPFDVFVEGLREHDEEKQDALSPAARRGLKLFLGRASCHFCHSGPNFSDGEFHNNRVPALDQEAPKDLGRMRGIERVRRNPFRGTSAFSDSREGEAELKVEYLLTHSHGSGEFKTPTLRNLMLTAPYMHQGQFATLEDIVRYYSTLDVAVFDSTNVEKILQPLDLSGAEVRDLLAFLQSLTDGSLDEELTRAPDSPIMGR